jgi:hypothetical protein
MDTPVSAVVGLIVLIALIFSPVRGRGLGRRAFFAVVFALVGETIVLASDSADWLRAGLMLLAAAVLLLAELAALGRDGGRILVGLLWLGCATVGVWQWSALGGWTGAHRAWITITAAVLTLVVGLTAARSVAQY